MQQRPGFDHLIKFFITSAACMLLGAVHGSLQTYTPIRNWLSAIGSPMNSPGRLIDPLAHAHLTVIGGIIIFTMGAMYYLLSRITGQNIYSRGMVEHSYWWTTLGMFGTYGSFMFFGIVEGRMLLARQEGIEGVHMYYGPFLTTAGSVMSIGFLIFFLNLLLTLRKR
jgi:cytochrome c oxidase cbb3-type subunit 1